MSTNATPRRRKAAEPQERKSVKVSCAIDVGTHARLCAAAALRGVTITALIEDAIKESLRGIVVFDRLAKGDDGDPTEEVSAVKPSPV